MVTNQADVVSEAKSSIIQEQTQKSKLNVIRGKPVYVDLIRTVAMLGVPLLAGIVLVTSLGIIVIIRKVP